MRGISVIECRRNARCPGVKFQNCEGRGGGRRGGKRGEEEVNKEERRGGREQRMRRSKKELRGSVDAATTW